MGKARIIFKVTLGEMAEVPGSPYSYWAPKSLRMLFKKYPPLDRDVAKMKDKPKIADVKVGLQTGDDLRFTRFWWEVPVSEIATSREETYKGKKWVPFAKGGRPYYHDIQVVVNWGNNGEEIKNYRDRRGKLLSRPQNESYYFRPGLAWLDKLSWSDVNVPISFKAFYLPKGAIFSQITYACFYNDLEKIWNFLSHMVSRLWAIFYYLIDPNPQHTLVGNVARFPFSEKTLNDDILKFSPIRAYTLLREWETGNETSTVFVAPWILLIYWRWKGKDYREMLPATGHPLSKDFEWKYGIPEDILKWLDIEMKNGFSLRTLAEASVKWELWLKETIDKIQGKIDDEVYRIYGISEEDRKLIESEIGSEIESESKKKTKNHTITVKEHIQRFIHFIAHNVIREDPDGIVPLNDFYPAGRLEHERGLLSRVYEKLQKIFGEDSMHIIEREIKDILGKSLNDWLAKEFISFHTGLYKLRPIIWQIVPPAGNGRRASDIESYFSVFIYWYKLDADTLKKVLTVYLEPYLRAAILEYELAQKRFHELKQASFKERKDAENRLQNAKNRFDSLNLLKEKIHYLLHPHKLKVDTNKEWVEEKVNEIVRDGYKPNRGYGVRVNIEPLKLAGILSKDAERVKG